MLQPYRYPSLQIGCVGAWCPSQGATGFTLLDRSGYNNHGTLTNMDASDWVAGDGKLALDIDITNDFVNCGAGVASRLNGRSSFSISAWVYRRSTGGGGNGRLYEFGIANSNYLTGSFGLHTTVTSGTSVTFNCSPCTANAWVHIAIVIEVGIAASVYYNNAPQTVSSLTLGSGTLSFSSNNFIIGNRENASRSSDSLVDDFRVYDRTLAHSEVAALALRRGIAYERTRSSSVRGATAPASNRRRRLLTAG